MKFLIISDLHIGVEDNFGIFGWKSKDFIDFLEDYRLVHNIDKIVLNGDTFELYKYSMKDIIKANKEIYGYLQRDHFIHLEGNHDFIDGKGRDHFVYRNSQGKTIYIEHGHNAEFFSGTRLGRFLCTASLNLVRFLVAFKPLLNIYFKIIEYDDQVNRIPRKYDSYKYLRYGLKLLKHYDTVVLGHTHKLEYHKTYYINSKKRYFNSGTCSLGRFQGVLLDSETLEYDLVKISKEDVQKELLKKKLRKKVS